LLKRGAKVKTFFDPARQKVRISGLEIENIGNVAVVVRRIDTAKHMIMAQSDQKGHGFTNYSSSIRALRG
jgi:hypothetical protein